MIQKIFKNAFIGFLILLVALRLSLPVVVLADDPTPTDSPAPTATQVDQTNVDNSATANNTVDSSANTGTNTVGDTTPTPTPDPSSVTPTDDPSITPTDNPTPTDDPSITDPNSSSVDASNSADVANTGTNSSNTGQNSVTTNSGNDPQNGDAPTPTPTPSSSVTVQTGDAVSVVAGDNTINTTAVNSDITNQTINIFGDQTGDIDLSTLFQLVSSIVTNDKNNDSVVNVQITGVNNYAYLSNAIVSSANTGANSVDSATSDVVVKTGNAESIVSLINKVNLTVVNSSLHLVTINIFGHLTGNIILPNITPLQSASCTSCGVSFNVNNQAVVNNTITSGADTGDNTILASDSGALTTGNAQSDINTLNIINQNALNAVLENLFINSFGNWNGSFLGWDSFLTQNSGNLALLSETPGQDGTTPSGDINSTNINNTAYVNNVISSLVNTGGNKVNGQNVNVTTGSAYSVVSLINFINSNFLNTMGFFGFINVFGNWDGNIGGAKEFAALTPTPESDTVSETSNSNEQESGGLLSQTNINNVGAYVLPGDTVTFFLTTKNIGTGKVYGAKLNLSLYKDGQNVGGTTLNLGDIPVSRGVKISTGLVLSKDAAPGEYIAKAVVTGTTGPDNTSVSAEADSNFTVFGSTIASTDNSPQIPNAQNIIHHAVLGSHTNNPTPESDAILLLLLGATIGSYLFIRGIRNRHMLYDIWTNSSSFKQKLLTIRILLL